MELQTAIAIVKRKLASANVQYDDISKTTEYDLLVRERFRVRVMYGRGG